MQIEIPEPEADALDLTPEEARLDLAVGLYARRRVTLGRAARIAGVAYSEFLQEAGRRGLCVDYDVEDAAADIEVVRKMRRG